MITSNDMIKEIQKGLLVQSRSSRGGCGRVYVMLSRCADRKVLNEFKKALAACDIRYLPVAYGTYGRSAYIGYNRADGTALSQAEAIARNLRSIGVDCYGCSRNLGHIYE
jgi:hypothetical protein